MGSLATPLGRLANAAWYQWRRNNWLLYLPRLYRSFASVPIERPIFFVGNQGGGLTLVSRMIRRHPDLVSISGGQEYWSGADEMQKVANLRLPPGLVLGGRWLGGDDPPHELFTLPRGWSYASDDLIGWYHLTEEDAAEEAARALRKVIGESLHRFGKGVSAPRFVDKSQVYTIKMRYVEALLADSEPFFVLLTRNPYASVYRAATKTEDMVRYAKHMSLDERVEVCAQHWANAMGTALSDGERVRHFGWFRFEDVLREPGPTVRAMCDHLELDFLPRMIPRAGDRVPFGTRFRDRWYPLDPDVNVRYLEKVPERHLDVVERLCGETAAVFGYERPRGDA